MAQPPERQVSERGILEICLLSYLEMGLTSLATRVPTPPPRSSCMILGRDLLWHLKLNTLTGYRKNSN